MALTPTKPTPRSPAARQRTIASHVTDEVTFLGFSAAWKSVRLLPERTAHKTFAAFADNVYFRGGAGVTQLRKNLAMVKPDLNRHALDDLTRAGMASYGRYWCDLFRINDWDLEQVNNVTTVGLENVRTGHAAGQGTICVGTHSGNYDHVTAHIAQTVGHVTAVAEQLKPKKLFNTFAAVREANNISVLPTGTARIVDVLSARVQAGDILALMGDRDISRKGIPVTFFGATASFPAGPALVAYRTGAALVPVSFYYVNGKSAATALPAVDVRHDLDEMVAVRKATQLVAQQMETLIGDNPQDWHMLQPLWAHDLTTQRR
jgi:lauroyl/myristoyl acyltransferase